MTVSFEYSECQLNVVPQLCLPKATLAVAGYTNPGIFGLKRDEWFVIV